jgi:hypothetical protein
MRWYDGILQALLLCALVYGQGQGKEIPDSILKEVPSVQLVPQGDYRAVRTWEAEGKEIAHSIGQAVADPEAYGNKAWEVKTYSDRPYRHLIYGPYIELEPGDYVAFFRIKLLEEAGEEVVADLDACVSFGKNILNSREITGSDLALNDYVQIPLPFRYPGGKLECRVFWRGYASVRVDRISLFRLEGGRIEIPTLRVSQPVPSGSPRGLTYRSEPRPFPELFPRSDPPASTLIVFDLRTYPPDWQFLLLTLQGIVNRRKPEIYYLFNPTDPFWLDWMRRRKWISGTETISDPNELISRYRDRIKGMIITDPMLPASKNIATMIAGVEDGIVVSPRIADRLSMPVIADLRGRWKSNAEAYGWAFDNLWDRLNHHVIACSWYEHLGLRDYLVQHRIFIFWISGPIDGAKGYASPDDEVRLMEKLLAQMPVNIPVMSYPWAGKDVGIGEGPGVTLFSEFGKYLVGSINCSNLSVHSGVRIPKFEQHAPPPVPSLQRDKVYVSFIISDGDNLPVLTISNFPQLWKNPVRGKLPLGWTISPSAYMLIPDIADYYYSTATDQDRFLGAVSGIGYAYPDSYGKRFREPDRRRVFDEFLDQTRTYMERMDLEEIWIMGVSREDLIGRYAERIPFLKAIFPDYGRRVMSYDEATYLTSRNVPVFHAVTGWSEGISREGQIEDLVSQIRAITPPERPAFMHLFVLNWFADLRMLQEILNRLGPEYVVVRPDHLAALYRQEVERRRILIHVPPSICGIENRKLLFPISLRNVTDSQVEVRIEISGGLDRPSLKPDRVLLSPGRVFHSTVSGIPSGGEIHIEVKAPFGTIRRVVEYHRVAEREIAGSLPSEGSLQFLRRFEAEKLAHRSGKEESDPTAHRGKVWSARRGEAEGGYIVFGPYSPMDAGDYLALFRLKRMGRGQGVAALIDTCVGGGNPITASREIRVEELPLEEFRSFPLLFHHPGGGVETRVLWTGSVSLAVDSITLWRIRLGGKHDPT